MTWFTQDTYMTYHSTQDTYCTYFTQDAQLKSLTLFWLYDPAFGDSDDEDMHLNDAKTWMRLEQTAPMKPVHFA